MYTGLTIYGRGFGADDNPPPRSTSNATTALTGATPILSARTFRSEVAISGRSD